MVIGVNKFNRLYISLLFGDLYCDHDIEVMWCLLYLLNVTMSSSEWSRPTGVKTKQRNQLEYQFSGSNCCKFHFDDCSRYKATLCDLIKMRS